MSQGVEQISWFGWTGVTQSPEALPEPLLKPGTIKQRDVLSLNFYWWISELNLLPQVSSDQWQTVTILETAFRRRQTDSSGPSALFVGNFDDHLLAYLLQHGWQVTVSTTVPHESFNIASKGQIRPTTSAEKKRIVSDQIRILGSHSGDSHLVEREHFDLVVTQNLVNSESLALEIHGQKFSIPDLLLPGGVSVNFVALKEPRAHETEKPTSFGFHSGDLSSMLNRLRKDGFSVEDHDFEIGFGILDEIVDTEPYRYHPHLRYRQDETVVTPASIIFSAPANR